MAYSTKINDPKFDKYLSYQARSLRIIGVILALIAFFGFVIYSRVSYEMDEETGLLVGSVIGGMFLLIGLYHGRNRNKKGKDWDGVVIAKNTTTERYKEYVDDSYQMRTRLKYNVIFQDIQTGEKYTYSYGQPHKYEYFNIGDEVRHHGKLNSLEKFDKSKDKIIFCNACNYPNEIERDTCVMCKCPLLK